MDLIKAIKDRRAVKHFDVAHEMTEDEIHQMMSLAALSPTSFNIQNWRFIVVRDKKQRKKLREAAWDQAQVTDASVVIVLCADMQAHAKSPQRYWDGAPQEVKDLLVPMIEKYYEGRDDLQRDEAMRSCGIAAQTIMLAAKELGYDSCPMVGFDFDAVAKIINLPKDHIIAMMITVGKRVKDPWPRAGKLPYEEVVIHDQFK